MMYSEFIDLVGSSEVTNQEYTEIIEPVYMWYPMFENGQLSDKKNVAALYKMGGLGVFEDLLPIAKQYEESYDAVAKACKEMQESRERYEKIVEERTKKVARYVRYPRKSH